LIFPDAGACGATGSIRRRRLSCCLAILHLSIAASFALLDGVHTRLGRLPLAAAVPLRLYGALTGGTAGYGFFSPDIAPEIRARFSVVGPGGQRRAAAITGANREADLRVGNLVNSQWDLRRTPESLANNRALAASCAGKIFANHPDAEEVDVQVEFYDLPTMSRYREGVRPRWVPYYRPSFTRPRAQSR
jgi:hypothetical protein